VSISSADLCLICNLVISHAGFLAAQGHSFAKTIRKHLRQENTWSVDFVSMRVKKSGGLLVAAKCEILQNALGGMSSLL
jgi:hypothetical protein